MLDTQLIESYKAQMMRSFIELWLKLCPDHRISMERGMGGHRLSIILPDSFAERLTFPKNSPIQTIKKTTTYRDEYGSTSADRERTLERQIECDELREAAKKDEEDGFLSVEEMNEVIKDIEKDKLSVDEMDKVIKKAWINRHNKITRRQEGMDKHDDDDGYIPA